MRHKIFSRATAQDEQGAVLVIITLSLIALFGMMVLVVDVGSVLFARRAIVNAADAAALAAAQSCGKQEGQDEADLQAISYTVANQSGAAVVPGYPKYTPSCENPWGFVRVRVTTERPLFFAPVLGFDSDTPVTFEAMASWGGAGAGEKVAPLMLSSGRLTDCDIPPPDPEAIPAQGVICAFWWNNSPRSQPEDLTNAEWGTLDLNNWDVPANDGCGGNPNPPDFEEWMLTGFFEPLPIHPPPTPTYVCKGVGNFGNSLNNIVEEAALRGDPLYFPVNDPQTQVDSGGGTCAPPPPGSSVTCSVHKYNIIGFAKLYIVGLYRGNSAESELYCGHIPEEERDSNARCMVARWTEYTPEGLNPQGGENFGLVPVRLVR
jgi:Putative Flp pilus-assembly TadE/G-like